jgi:catechol 2,3-dioxygenase-like lactoylglutathione lyase family enzyme
MELKIELFVKSSRKSAQFYQDFLDFEIVKDENNGVYIVMKLGNVKLALNTISSLSESHYFKPEIEKQRLGLGVEIVFEVDDIKTVYKKIKVDYPIENPLKLQSWGKTDFRIKDPDGYYLRITSKI